MHNKLLFLLKRVNMTNGDDLVPLALTQALALMDILGGRLHKILHHYSR